MMTCRLRCNIGEPNTLSALAPWAIASLTAALMSPAFTARITNSSFPCIRADCSRVFRCCEVETLESTNAAMRTRHCFNENVLSFAIELGRHQANARNVGPRPRQRGHKSGIDQILRNYNKWYRFGRLLKRTGDQITTRRDHIRCSLDCCRDYRVDLLILGQETRDND